MTIYKFMVGVVLAFAMVAVLTLSALVFSARDFQFGVATIAPATNGLVSFSALDAAAVDVAELEEQSAEPRGQLLQIEEQLRALDTRVQANTAAANTARAEIVGAVAAIENRASVQSPANATSTDALITRLAAVGARPGLPASDQQALVSLNARVDQLREQEAAGAANEAQRATLLAEQATIGTRVAESNRLIYGIQQRVVPDHDHFTRVVGEVNALRTLSPWGVSAYFAQGHPALLSTILVLLMGALGSLLYLFPAYLNRAVPVTMAEIVVRLIFGMCAALAVYVLANAAIAGFSMGSGVVQATTSSALNPFTVSLVGIVAGVLSEDIAKWIQDRGRGIFQQGGVAANAPASDGGGLVNNQAIS